ncbi:MAG: GtrA family protein [Patescibacteria group bacterium]
MKNLLIELFKKFWSREFLRYFLIGLSAFILDIGTLFILKERFNLSPVLSVVLNQILMINFVFFLNKYWSFRSGSLKRKEALRFLIVAALNYLIAVIWMAFFNHYLGLNYLLVRFVNVVLAVSWNFLLYKHFVYVQRKF